MAKGVEKQIGPAELLTHDETAPEAHNTPQKMSAFECRIGCGACCIAPSIETPFFGMPQGKRAGQRCVHLDSGNRCELFGKPERPKWCGDLRASVEMCGNDDAEALRILTAMEEDTRP